MNQNSVVKITQKFSPWIIEEEILSALIQNRQKLTTFIDEVNPDFFNSVDCKNIFKMIKVYWEKYSSSPKKNVIVSSIQKLIAVQAGKPVSPTIFVTVDKIFDRAELSEDELQYYHDELLKFIKSGKIKDIIFEGINKIDDPEAFDKIQEDLKEAVLWRIDENLGIDITNVKERYSRQRELLESYIPTPWSSLNSLIGGGFFAKTLSCFVAGSSVGKSIALDQIAFDAWANQKKNVILISLELSEEMKGMRIDSHFMNRFIGELPAKEKEVEEAYSRINTDGKRFIIKEFPTSSIPVRKISHFISRLEMYSGFKPDLIVVDYADLLSSLMMLNKRR
jgi:replicative DNA helicase